MGNKEKVSSHQCGGHVTSMGSRRKVVNVVLHGEVEKVSGKKEKVAGGNSLGPKGHRENTTHGRFTPPERGGSSSV